MNLPEERYNGLAAAEKFSLPVEEITKRIVETYKYVTFYFLLNDYKHCLSICELKLNF